ncbi:conserved hypothetical protein [Lausannevirus]|uniref:Uncharacterized protein n=2 Tax=Lausannevirus TaxID=999883 RepID=A0A0N9P8K8_9VIRU|nr:hypothetical protein LAU_0104 [Lausannevirus]AEA06956.1 conserved hypothetical protein [Lausannevirus]ALH06788.1 hypothetical protein PMV_090 [Port-miou virus]
MQSNGVFYRGAARKSAFGPSQRGWAKAEFFVLSPDGIMPDFRDVRDAFGRPVPESLKSQITTGGCANGSLFVFVPRQGGGFQPVCNACPPPARQVKVLDRSQMVGDVRRIVVADGQIPPIDPRHCLVAGPMENNQNCPGPVNRWRFSQNECPFPSVSQQVQRQKYWGYGI